MLIGMQYVCRQINTPQNTHDIKKSISEKILNQSKNQAKAESHKSLVESQIGVLQAQVDEIKKKNPGADLSSLETTIETLKNQL